VPNKTASNAGDAGAGKPEDGKGLPIQDAVRTWVMVALTFIFAALYVGALFGLIPGSAKQDQQTLTRIESVVFVIIGYYFGRLPAQATEKTLKDEIHRQTQKADQAEEKKGDAQQQSQALEEKVKNAKAALASVVPGTPPVGLAMSLSKATPPPDALQQSVLAAVHVLES